MEGSICTHAALGKKGMKILTADEPRELRLDGEAEETLFQTPMVEDLGHVGRYPIATAPIFLDQGQNAGEGEEREERTSMKS